ncbi:hypothetical protein P3L10_001586 [Capsicum annuum]
MIFFYLMSNNLNNTINVRKSELTETSETNHQMLFFCAVKYVNPITKLCIIRASREEYQKVWASITMVRSVGSCPVVFNLLDLSGNIRACRAAALKCDEFKFQQYQSMAGARVTPEIQQQMQNYLDKIKVLEH